MFKKSFILLNADATGGNGSNATAPSPEPPANEPAAAPPISAAVVMTGARSERETDLEAELQVARTELQNERGSKTKLEKDIAYLQDQLAQLRAVPSPETAAAPQAVKAHWLKEFGM